MKKIKLLLVFCMLTISNLIFASIVHVPNVNATVAYSTGGGFPTPITLTVDATDIDFTYSDFAGINAQNFNSPTGNIFTVTPAGTYSDELKLYQFNDPINGSNFLNIDGATGYGPMQPGQEPAGINYVGVKTANNNYAWIMIDVVPGVEIIIMGFAFEDNGVPIDAGDIGIVPPNSVYNIVSNSTVHTTLKVAIDACSLDGALSGAGPFTLFAPTDAAFNLLGQATITALLADIPQLTDILLHHVVGDSVLSTMLSNNLVVPTLNGDVLVTINSMSEVFIDNAQVIFADLVADNGVVHVVDAVLLPTTTSVSELNHLDKVYSYSINILGEKINRNLRNQIIFDVYIDGSITKRYVR